MEARAKIYPQPGREPDFQENEADYLNDEFGFDLDVCALPENAKCINFYTPDQNGLSQQWDGVVWCNPPYGREIGKWVKKAFYENQKNNNYIVMLLPARTDTMLIRVRDEHYNQPLEKQYECTGGWKVSDPKTRPFKFSNEMEDWEYHG